MRMIFANLPVKDLEASKRLFGELGFGFDPKYEDDEAACLVIDENIFFMLMVVERFKDFINGDIADRGTTETINCLSAGRREEVDETIKRAIAAGGKEWKPTTWEEGPMYAGSFQELDGHVWELLHMEQR